MPIGTKYIQRENQLARIKHLDDEGIVIYAKTSTDCLPRDVNGKILPDNYSPGYRIINRKEIKPDRVYDVINLAKIMNDENLAPRVKELFDPEVQSLMESVRSGHYYSFRPKNLPQSKVDCIRIGMNGRCFCTHQLHQHERYNGQQQVLPCDIFNCKCKAFAWVPSRPEETGVYWLPNRRPYDQASFRVKCRCKHSHGEHEAYPPPHKCTVAGCNCTIFHSGFVCAACDLQWHQHTTILETTEDRIKSGRPIGPNWFPFNELPPFFKLALTGVHNPSEEVLRDAVPLYLREKMVIDQRYSIFLPWRDNFVCRPDKSTPEKETSKVNFSTAPSFEFQISNYSSRRS